MSGYSPTPETILKQKVNAIAADLDVAEGDIDALQAIRAEAQAQSVAAQAISTTDRTYIAGSEIECAAGDLKAGTQLHWRLVVTKTAAGTATATFDIAFGASGTVTDTARIEFTKPAGTAAADTAIIDIIATVRGAGEAVVAGAFKLTHNLASTGFATIPCVAVSAQSAAFDNSEVTSIGLCATLGASDAYTFEIVQANCIF